MPLVRYEVRCEHSLANPELYRTAVRDDSEGLLEGVAMAGLVGLVRQLGDLAEFASEIFHDLHDDIMKIVSRGQNLKTRVTRLEADLPVVEKALLAKASQFRFAYTARSKWRAPLPMDQNICAQGELPRFVRNFYDDCRGPPRLFLLDKFDGDGRGACVKRYTDPTFFRLTWATSQLEKAEQAEQAERERQEQFEQQAQQEKKSSLKKSSSNAGPLYPRERLSSAHFENLEGFTGDFTPEFRSKRLDRVPEVPTDGDLTPDEPRSPDRSFQKRQLPEVDQGPVLAPLKISAKDIENAKLGRRMQRLNHEGASDEEGASEYVDAMTTMGSDVDSEHDSRSRWGSAQKSVDSTRLSVDSEHDSRSRWGSAQKSVDSARLSVDSEHDSHYQGSVEQNRNGDFARKLDLKEPEFSSIAGVGVVREWGDSPAGQLAIEDSKSRFSDESITVEDARNGHANIGDSVDEDSQKLPDEILEMPAYDSMSVRDVYRTRAEEQRVEARDQSLVLESEAQDYQFALANVEQTVTTPRSRRLWARDNGSQAQTSSILSLVDIDRRSLNLNDGLDLGSRLRARLLESTGTSSSSRALVPHQGEAREEQEMELSPGQTGYELSYRSSSNTSSPYTNVSSSVEDDDGFTSESASSSPKGPNFCTLLSPPESPPRQARGLMGSPSSYNTNSRSGRSSPRAPPITPFLSFSPSVSRSSSIKRDPSVSLVDKVPQNYLDQATPSPKPLISPPQRDTTRRSSLSLQMSDASSAHSPEKIKDILVTDPRRASDNGGLELEPSRSEDQTSTLPNPVSRPRTWFDRSESNVAATLRAIRQAAAVGSDDDTGSECRSDCS